MAKKKNPHAVALGRLGGLKGGKARTAKLTPEQREQIRMIEEEAIFGWMRGPQSGKPPGTQEKRTNERILAVLTEEQVRHWKAIAGEPVKFAIAPFGSREKGLQKGLFLLDRQIFMIAPAFG